MARKPHYTIFKGSGRERRVQPYLKASTSGRTICCVHRLLAYRVFETQMADQEAKAAILDLVNEAYDKGRRMGEALMDLHNEFVELGLKKKGWRDGF